MKKCESCQNEIIGFVIEEGYFGKLYCSEDCFSSFVNEFLAVRKTTVEQLQKEEKEEEKEILARKENNAFSIPSVKWGEDL